jgi:hypothetical protein
MPEFLLGTAVPPALMNAGVQILKSELAAAIGSGFQDLFAWQQSYLKIPGRHSAAIDNPSADAPLPGFQGTHCVQVCFAGIL